MKSIDCFTEIETKSTELALYLEDLVSSQDLFWQEHFGFDALPIENSWIKKELALSQIDEIHSIKQLGLLKIPSKSFYNWHVDDFRQSCINMLISTIILLNYNTNPIHIIYSTIRKNIL